MTKRFIFSILLILIFISVQAQQKPLAVIPLFNEGPHTFIEASVNGSGKKYIFLFDTGAGSSVVSKRLASEEKLIVEKDTILETAGGKDTVPISFNNTLKLDSLSEPNIHFFIDELSHITFKGKAIDGAIGYDLLKQYITHINYETNQLEFYKTDQNLFTNYDSIPFKLIEEIPAIELKFTTQKGHPKKAIFYFDSGAGFSLSFNSSFAHKINLLNEFDKKVKVSAIGASANHPLENYISSMSELKFGKHTFKDIPVSISLATEGVSASTVIDGILGIDIIKRFNIVLDYQRCILKFLPNQKMSVPFNFNLTGLSLRKDKEKIVISNVLENSPAQQAGFKKNDVIISVDGENFNNVAELKNLLNNQRKTFTVSVLRESKSIELMLKPERFY